MSARVALWLEEVDGEWFVIVSAPRPRDRQDRAIFPY